jgi:MoaA/NifB/PqqE/SkfB family radical SAM enzyme
MYKSCYDLENSIFLGPNEIRGCCKRYFVDGKMKGDIVLCKVDDSEDAEAILGKIESKKKQIVAALNTGEGYDDCNGCPHIHERDWGGDTKDASVRYLSLEYHSICNMRCDYCSEQYYGGQQQNYSVEGFISILNARKLLKNADYIVWGGGEPTLDKEFKMVLNSLLEIDNRPKVRVITNALLYSKELQEAIDSDDAYIVTSIDAGTEVTFRKVRGARSLEKVFCNLQRYAKKSPHNVIVKYIVKGNNSGMHELNEFVSRIAECELMNCFFQISCDFKSEELRPNELASILVLFDKLVKIGSRYVFMDDLILQRLPVLDQSFVDEMSGFINIQNGSMIDMYSRHTRKASKAAFCIMGTGAQARLMRDRLTACSLHEEIYYVDPNGSFKGSNINGTRVINMTTFRTIKHKYTIIGAVQASLDIYHRLVAINEEETLIKVPVL